MKFKNVVDNLNILKLDKIADCLTEYVDKVNSEKIPFLDALPIPEKQLNGTDIAIEHGHDITKNINAL